MPKIEKLETRLDECLREDCVKKYVQEYYAAEGKPDYPSVAVARWRKGSHFPPIDVLVGIAKALDTNISYILGLTDVKCPLEYEEPICERCLEEILEACEMTEKEFVKAYNNNYKMLYLYRERIPLERVRSVIKLSMAVGLSVDFILGYTNYENWEIYDKMHQPFSNIKNGGGAYVIADKTVRGAADIESAVMRGDGSYCLLSYDGKHVIFPNGNKVAVDDEIFEGVYVTNVVPEVK